MAQIPQNIAFEQAEKDIAERINYYLNIGVPPYALDCILYKYKIEMGKLKESELQRMTQEYQLMQHKERESQAAKDTEKTTPKSEN